MKTTNYIRNAALLVVVFSLSVAGHGAMYQAKVTAIEISDLSEGGLRFPLEAMGVADIESLLGNSFVSGVEDASMAFIQDHTLAARSKVVFDWSVVDRSSSSLDFAFYGARSAGSKVFEIFDSGLGEGPSNELLRQGTYMSFLDPGTYTVGVGVAGDGIRGEDYELSVRDFRIEAVEVPDVAAIGLLELLAIGGLLGFGRFLRRVRR